MTQMDMAAPETALLETPALPATEPETAAETAPDTAGDYLANASPAARAIFKINTGVLLMHPVFKALFADLEAGKLTASEALYRGVSEWSRAAADSTRGTETWELYRAALRDGLAKEDWLDADERASVENALKHIYAPVKPARWPGTGRKAKK